jgi:hypothetical protein
MTGIRRKRTVTLFEAVRPICIPVRGRSGRDGTRIAGNSAGLCRGGRAADVGGGGHSATAGVVHLFANGVKVML